MIYLKSDDGIVYAFSTEGDFDGLKINLDYKKHFKEITKTEFKNSELNMGNATAIYDKLHSKKVQKRSNSKSRD